MALAPCLFISCGKEIAEHPDTVKQLTIIASVERKPETRNTIANIDNNVVKIEWTKNDSINVFFGDSGGSKFTTEESGEVAKFKGSIDVAVGGGEGLTDDTSLWGVYPYKSTTTCDGTYVYYTLPSEQEAAENTFAKELFPQIAKSRNFYMTFYNPCASIRFTVESNDIKAVSLKGNNGESLAGKAKISMESVPKVESIESGETELMMYAPNGGCFTPGVTYYFVLFPTEFTKGLSITYYKENSYATYSHSKAYTLGRNKFSRFLNRDSGLTFKTYTDLSASATANCYLIQNTGDYKFKAVQGNTDDAVGNVKSVEVLWESFGTTEKPNVGDLISSVSYLDGYIRFSTPATFKDGNALIAAKDASGTILWSWHIWCASEGWKEQVYNNDAGTMMDRNLGATSAAAGEVGSLGLFYQWGRKDPFLGAAKVDQNYKVRAASTGEWATSSNSITPSLAEQNPMTFYTGDSNYLPDGSWDSKKTRYDPCPAGWRVPDGGSDGTWCTAIGGGSSSIRITSSSSYGLSLDGGNIFSSEAVWYPASGCLTNDSGALRSVGFDVYYWSVTSSSGSGNANYLYFNGLNTVVPSAGNYRSTGMSVRCLKE